MVELSTSQIFKVKQLLLLFLSYNYYYYSFFNDLVIIKPSLSVESCWAEVPRSGRITRATDEENNIRATRRNETDSIILRRF